MTQGKHFLFACFIFGVLFALPAFASAATIYSNYTSGNDTTGAGTSGNPYKTFHKAYTVASSGDTIDLTGTFNWANADETGDLSTSGYTLTTDNLTIRGQGANATIIQAASTIATTDRRVFTMNAASTTFSGLTIRHGNTSNGGCFILSVAGTTTLNTVAVDRCNASIHGGAFYNTTSNTNVVASNSSFTGNTAGFSGGGFFWSTTGGTLQMTSATLSGNISNISGSSNSTNGGAALNLGSGTMRLTNVTLTGNSSPFGALKLGGGTALLKNTIVAGNTGITADNVNLYRSSGTITSSGYNIFGRYSTSYFNATTTGDWDDRTGSGTYRLFSVGTTGTLSLSATTTAANGTQYAPFATGSIGINHGITTAHGSVTIPSTDQLGFSRSGETDIGAYEYDGVSDATAPSVTLDLPANGASIGGSSIGITATASDDIAVAGVKFYVNNILVGSEDTSSPYSITWNSLSATTSGTKTVIAVARDTSNNYATSTSATVTLNNTPTPSSITASSTVRGVAAITWTTPYEGSSRMFFGFVSAVSSSTPEANAGSGVTSHSVDLSGLPACAVYQYVTVSRTSGGDAATSSTSSLRTAGCTGGASIVSNNQGAVTTGAGGTLTEGVLTLTIPTSFTASSSSATFQASQLDGSTFFASAGAPSGLTRATTTVYHLSAYTDESTTLSTFTSALTVTMSYDDADVTSVDESSLTIHRYDGTTWSELSSCTVDTGANTVSCTTTGFSDFGIFGEASSSSGGSSGSSSGGSVVGLIGSTGVYVGNPAIIPAAASASSTPDTPTPTATAPNKFMFTRNLRVGSEGEDVRELQIFLNSKGFVIAQKGSGAPGEESTTFGPRTRAALIKFQEAYTTEILKPLDLQKGTGIFATQTRKFVNSLP